MGHIRLGKLPKDRPWKEVVALLREQSEDLPGIAGTVLHASSKELGSHDTVESLGQAFALLVRLAQASDGGDLGGELRKLGIEAEADTPALGLLAELGDRLRENSAVYANAGHHREMAALALRRTLIETVGTQGPSLFGSRLDQLEAGFRRWSGGDRFGRMSRWFFGDFLARVLHSAVDRELSNHVRKDGSFGEVGEAREFSVALDRYARETAAIAERFATDWYAKHRWRDGREISEKECRAFTAVALEKLRTDLAFARESA